MKNNLFSTLILIVIIFNLNAQEIFHAEKFIRANDSIYLTNLPKLELPDLYKGPNAPLLPSELDNSELPYLRPVFIQYGWSCGQASSVGYNFTYEINRVNNTPADTSINQFPPLFTFNFYNEGEDGIGVCYLYSFNTIKSAGNPNVADYGGMGDNLRRWASGYDIYYHAMFNRIDEVYSLYVGDENGLLTLKHWLHDHLDGSQYGSIANFYTDMWVYTTLPPGTPEEGKSVVIAFGPYTGHSMTFIGWNDSIRYDYNNDGQYTNDIDINGDEVVNMKDWEIGGLKLVNSWGEEQFADSGFCYVMYKVLAEEKLDGGIWNKSVNMIDVKEDYSPMLTFKIQLKHNYRNKIKVIAGISEDTTDIWPAYTMDFPIFNYQGGGYYMQGGATEEDKNIEFGLDITHLLSYVENDSSVKFFLQIHENDPQNIGTGKIVSFSLMDYLNGGQEIVCPETDVSLIENSFTTLSVIHNLTFDKVEIETNELPAYVPGEQYTHQLLATGGSSPYDWRILSRYTENQYEDDYPDIQGEELIPVGYLETHAIQPIGFSFPFYGELYDTIIIHTDGFIMFREKEYPLPYQVDDMLLFKFEPMLALFLNEDLMISQGYDNGLWYEGDENQAAFRWKVTIEADDYDYQLDFTAVLYPDGKIEYYFNEFENPDLLNRITGVSKGDGINLEIAEFSNLLSTKSSQVVSYTSLNFLASMHIDDDGLLSVYPEANNIIYNLTIEVTDINNISATKNFQLSENIVFDYSVVSGDNNIIEYNETAIISFSIKNIGYEVLDDLMLSINNQNLFINLLDSTEYIGSINPGQTIQLPDAISFSVADSIPDNYDIILLTEFTGTDYYCEGRLIVNAYAPILVPGQPIVSDNNNGRLDPGETVDLLVCVSNYGHSPILSVTGQLSTDDPNITIGNSGNLNFGDLANGQTSFDTISVSADENTPEGHLATFGLSISAPLNFHVTDSFALLIGRFPVLIIDLDPEWVSGPIIKSTIEELDVLHDYLYFIPENTEIYQNIFISLGRYSSHHELTYLEGLQLADFLNSGGNIYMEGGTTWYGDMTTPVHPMFNIDTVGIDWQLTDSVIGVPGVFTENMMFELEAKYTYYNNYFIPVDPAFRILHGTEPEHIFATAYDIEDYKTIGSLIDFAGLVDNQMPSTKLNLMTQILQFFGVDNIYTTINPNFDNSRNIALNCYPNPFSEQTSVNFYLQEEGDIDLALFDFFGNKISNLYTDEKLLAGFHSVNIEGQDLPNGIYFCVFKTNTSISCLKLIKLN